jgi:hypothetical protein
MKSPETNNLFTNTNMNNIIYCDYPKNHTEMPMDTRLFVAQNFIKDGVNTFYGLDKKEGARNNLTIENFKAIHDVKRDRNLPIKVTAARGEMKDFFPVSTKNCLLLGINMNHSNIYCVDIDGPKEVGIKTVKWNDIPEILRSCPYTKSRNKELPHFFFRIDNADLDYQRLKMGGSFTNASKNLTFCRGELLTSAVWEKKSSTVYNYNDELPVLKWKDVKQFITEEESMKFEKKVGSPAALPAITFQQTQIKDEYN